MGLRFRKSFKLAPGVRLNLGMKSSGLSFGGRGCRYSINTRGRRTSTFGIPGTGISYSSSSGGKRKRTYKSKSYTKQKELQKAKEKQKLEEQKRNTLLVEEYENYIELIQNVHRECDESIIWSNIATEPEPFIKTETGPKEVAAKFAVENFKPNFIEKYFLKNGEKRLQKLMNKIESAQQEDVDDYTTWEESVEFANRILNGDIDAYYEALDESNPFEDLVEFGSGFEFGTDRSNLMEIEFTVKSGTVVPKKSKSLTKTGKLSEKDLTKTAYYDITQDYVCSCAIRLAREIFALLPVNIIIVHAEDTILNSSTGRDESITILSVGFTRQGFENIDFDRIDASDFVERFTHTMGFKKTSGFQPVKRVYVE